MPKLENIVNTVKSGLVRNILLTGSALLMYACGGDATSTSTPTPKNTRPPATATFSPSPTAQRPESTPEATEEPYNTPTPESTYPPTPDPSPTIDLPTATPPPTPTLKPTPTPKPLEVIVKGEIPKPITIDLSTIQYLPVKSYESKIGNTNFSMKDILERAIYELTGKVPEKVLTRDGELVDRVRVFLMPYDEYVKKHGSLGIATQKNRTIRTADNNYVVGVDVDAALGDKVASSTPFYSNVSALAHEILGHGYANMYEEVEISKAETHALREAVATTREIALIRNLEKNYGLTAYKVADTEENRKSVEELATKVWGEPTKETFSKLYRGIWDEVLSNTGWSTEAKKGKLSPQVLWNLSEYLLTQPRWEGISKLYTEQQQQVRDALINRLDSGNYNGNPRSLAFFLP